MLPRHVCELRRGQRRVAEMQRRRGCGAARRAAMRSLGSGELRSGQRHVAEPRAEVRLSATARTAKFSRAAAEARL